ncbi:hypothetical protein [Piscinibacter terrae]|nr:hypothetical protein [Albitalea terrae]
MKALVGVMLGLAGMSAMAAGYSLPAVPTRVDVIRGDGFMVHGEYGNSGGCTDAGRFFVRSDHPQYKQLYAMAMGAYVGKLKLIAYVDACQVVTWYSSSTTFNTVSPSSALHITD